MGRKILLITIIFLGLSSAGMMLNELAFRFFEIGLINNIVLNMPGATIGFFEAHGLAVLCAFFLYCERKKNWTADLNLYAAVIHTFLGFANIIFWNDAFTRFGILAAGIITTALHLILTVLNLVSFAKAKGTKN